MLFFLVSVCVFFVELEQRVLHLGVHVVVVYVAEDLRVLGHALADPLRVEPAELVVVLLQADPLHSQDDVRHQHQVLHALHVLSVHFH